MQRDLWEFVNGGIIKFHQAETELEMRRIQDLMAKYHDLPMDLADATLVAAAETLKIRRVFTLDTDFRIYRTADGGSFDLVP